MMYVLTIDILLKCNCENGKKTFGNPVETVTTVGTEVCS